MTNMLEVPGCGIPLLINGKVYTLNATPGLSDTIAALADEAMRLAALTENGRRSGVTAAFLVRAIDELLGEGSSAEIFRDGEPDLFGLCDIITFIAVRFERYRDMRRKRLAENGRVRA